MRRLLDPGFWARVAGLAALAIRAPGPTLASLGRLSALAIRRGPRAALAEFHVRASRVLAVRNYSDYVARFDADSSARLAAQQLQATRFTLQPVVSIVMPVCDPSKAALAAAMASVAAQSYPHWQLCIADDASQQGYVRELIDEFSARHPERTVAVFRSERGHISAASNDALALASGSHVIFLDHDDELSPEALFRLVEHLQSHPEHRLVYSDEDKLDARGVRIDPYFKPDWNPELFVGQNYLCHVILCERALVEDVGRFRSEFDGAQDYDLWLRCTEQLTDAQIGHVPRILYHWRAGAASTAAELVAKPYAVDAGARAITSHLERTGEDATVEMVTGGHYRVKRRVACPVPTVSIIIPTRDRPDLVRSCVESILARTRYDNYEIVLVDNQSRQPATLQLFTELTRDWRIRLLEFDAPFNYSAINNFAAAQCTTDILVLLNNDVEVISDEWLTELVSHAKRERTGCVGAMLYYPNDTIQHAGVIVGVGGVAGHAFLHRPRGHDGYFNRARLVQNLSCVTGACLAVRRSVYLEAGGLDEALTVAFNDVDFCLRVATRGYRNVWTPFAELYHHESATRGREDSPEKVLRFNQEVAMMQRRWGRTLRSDPAYNPNLSLVTEPFTLDPGGPRWADYGIEPETPK